MKEITLTVDNHYVATLLAFLKNLTYVQVQKVAESEPKPLTDAEKLALLFQISGAWKDERSTESILQDLQQTRLFNRTRCQNT
jgi:ATP phosphoribosyltransferase regulatory subunit HisZ